MSLGDLQKEKPFSFQRSKNGLVRISYHGQVVTSLSGKEADKFALKIEQMSGDEAQLLMAKATGHFKRGNEKLGLKSREQTDGSG